MVAQQNFQQTFGEIIRPVTVDNYSLLYGSVPPSSTFVSVAGFLPKKKKKKEAGPQVFGFGFFVFLFFFSCSLFCFPVICNIVSTLSMQISKSRCLSSCYPWTNVDNSQKGESFLNTVKFGTFVSKNKLNMECDFRQGFDFFFNSFSPWE